MAPPRSDSVAPPQGGAASGPAEPDPRRLLGGAAPPGRRRRRWPWALLLGIVVLAPALVAAGLWWCVRSEAGSAWLLGQVPGLRVTGAKGSLVGDFAAGRAELALPRGGVLAIEGLRWQGLRLGRAGSAWRLRIEVERLAAARVDLQPGAPSPDPLVAPQSLVLPIELQVGMLQVQALHATPLGETPLRELQGALQLGADDGRLHRVDRLEAAWGRLRAGGSASVGATAPLPVQARLELRQDGAAPGSAAGPSWNAGATLAGPLAALQLRSTLQAQAAPGPDGRRAAAQSLDLTALLRPFEAWPLGDLQAHARSLDLSALHPSAPLTALSGEALIQSQAYDRPATAKASLENGAAGRWNEGRLPLQRVQLELAARPDDPATFELRSLDAELGTTQQPAGRLQGKGRWARTGWTLDATLTALQPSRLDARAATMQLGGPLQLAGSAPGATAQTLSLRGELNGQLAERGPARAVRLKLDATARRGADGDQLELHEALATAGGARASLAGTARRATPAAPWQLKGRTQLADFDPLPWWPGREDSPWRRGPHRLNAGGDFDLTLPAAPGTLIETLAGLRGQAALRLADSVLAGVPLRGEATARSDDGTALVTAFRLEAAGNRVQADGRIATRGAGDRWALSIDAPALAAFAPVWRLLRPELPEATLAGALVARAQLDGRWPALSSTGQATATGLRVDQLGVQRGEARWQAGTGLDSPVDAEATLSGASAGAAKLDTVTLKLQGSGRAHRGELRAESKARPPAWVDTLQAAPPAAAAAASAPSPGPTVAVLQAQGGLVDAAGALAGWRGTLPQIELRGGEGAWLRSRDVGLELLGLDAAPLRVTLQPGRAELLGTVLRWSRVAWQAGAAGGAARLEAQAELEPVAVAPLLARLQPDFGWGGDLRVAGRLEVASAPAFHADVVLERERGDLTVTDETGTQALGLTDLRLGLNVADGVWSFTQGLAGSTLGVAAGAFVARTSPQASWPAPDTPVSGVLELRVANLGTWGTWVPAGWRLGGALRVSAGIGGTFGGPEFTGDLQGSALSVRNFVQGVNVSDGEVAVTLQGASARIERFSARAGAGSLQLEGDAALGAAPQARLRLTAQKFQLLGRVDRRIVASGEARLQLDRDRLQLDGQFGVDEGLIDFTRSDAPSLGDDVTVQRGRTAETGRIAAAPGGSAGGSAPVRLPSVTMDLRVALGEQLRLRGRGLDTRLAGELRLTSPGGRLAVNGTVRALDGTYAAYGQKLEIDRGELSFNGAAENPRLDIEATRPNLDVRVGVAVTGSAANPRVRLFSEPELSEIDKLSWLVLGRASDGLGRTDTALLQRAALALLSGDREGPTDQLTKAIGLDEVSVRQTDGEVRETVVSLGKQLSRRWYVGYERGLNATTGTWQLIYRIAQRFTLRAQSGDDSSLDVIWTWRWN